MSPKTDRPIADPKPQPRPDHEGPGRPGDRPERPDTPETPEPDQERPTPPPAVPTPH
jgi:hypothetical protein